MTAFDPARAKELAALAVALRKDRLSPWTEEQIGRACAFVTPLAIDLEAACAEVERLRAALVDTLRDGVAAVSAGANFMKAEIAQYRRAEEAESLLSLALEVGLRVAEEERSLRTKWQVDFTEMRRFFCRLISDYVKEARNINKAMQRQGAKLARLKAENEKLRAENAELRDCISPSAKPGLLQMSRETLRDAVEVLKKVQDRGGDCGTLYANCPACSASDTEYKGTIHHDADCKLAAVIARAERVLGESK